MTESDIWYHIYPLGFLGAEDENPAPGAADGPIVHRLPGLLDWLDYLVDLGITALLIGPVFESATHGYDVVDPYRVDRRLGSESDLVCLIDECHRRSLRLGLDVVFYMLAMSNERLVVVLSTDDKPSKCNVPSALAATAGNAESTLPPHGWGIWSTA